MITVMEDQESCRLIYTPENSLMINIIISQDNDHIIFHRDKTN
jgi:hypothetical protein